MAIKIDRQNGQNYAENIANSALSFNSGTWTVASGTGTSTISPSTYFEGVSSLRLQNNVPASDLTVTNSNHTTVIGIDGNYQISLHLRKDVALEQRQLDVLVYQNAVLLDTQSCLVGSADADLDDNDEWVRYQLGSGYALNKLDEITFQFVLKGTATAEPTTIMFIDALMINPAERGNLIVPYYAPPIETVTVEPVNYVEVNSLSDLPSPSSGIINLLDGYTYMFNTHVDLNGNRLVSNDAIVNIYGRSSETSSITSTGLGAGVPLITSNTTIKLGDITIRDVDTGLNLNKDTIMALDWFAVNFTNIPNLWDIGDIDNFVFQTGAISNCNNGLFTGEFDSFVVTDSFLGNDGVSGSLIDLTSTAVCTRRIRIQDCAFLSTASATSINVDVSSTIPDENLILKFNNFAGGTTYLTGVDETDDIASFDGNIGINNTQIVSWYYMEGNATQTPLTANTPTKILGTTTSNAFTSGFTNTDNRATYNRASTRNFDIKAVLSFNINADIDDFVFSIYKNGSVIPGSEQSQLTEASFGNAQGYTITLQAITSLAQNDYIEIYVENTENGTDITVSDLSVITKIS